jgi:hypothetical protein
MPYKDKARQAAHRKAYYEANKEKQAAYDKVRYAANKESKAVYNRAYYAANKELEKAKSRARYAANPERHAARKRKQKTGWTEDAYRAKLAEQEGRCAICDTDRCSRGRAMSADHCHRTGKPRGILCCRCNRAIGQLGDNAEGLRRAFAYLVRYETETTWQKDTNDNDTIDTSATDHTPDVQPTHQRGGHDLRDVGRDSQQSDAAPEVAVGRHARQAA